MIDWDTAVLAGVISVFGEPVTYTPAIGAPLSITGVFDEAYQDLTLAGGTAMTTSTPVLGVRVSDFPALPAQGDTLVIASTGEAFTVKEVRADGHGWAKLMLNYIGA